ncbi:MAG: Hsp20/alpha crystallin family protein [Deltaproteobacteria bacterium]|nr:Hsp20/alpha crystallin family protein [Deltaproteobacteria bacterium]
MHNPADVALDKLEALMEGNPFLRDLWGNARPTRGFSPAADVILTSASWLIQVELPGLKRDQVDVRIEGQRLIIRGTKPLIRPEGSRVRSQERGGGAFSREFELPPDADTDQVRAVLRDGVLEVTVARGAQVPHSVEVES